MSVLLGCRWLQESVGASPTSNLQVKSTAVLLIEAARHLQRLFVDAVGTGACRVALAARMEAPEPVGRIAAV
jgi:hypothetical protein